MLVLNVHQTDALCQLSDGLCTVTHAVNVLNTTGVEVEMITYGNVGSVVVHLRQKKAGALFSNGKTGDGAYSWELKQLFSPLMSS